MRHELGSVPGSCLFIVGFDRIDADGTVGLSEIISEYARQER